MLNVHPSVWYIMEFLININYCFLCTLTYFTISALKLLLQKSPMIS